MIAHRPALLRRASLIYVSSKKDAYVQMGTHDDLMRAPGYYRTAVSMQSEIAVETHSTLACHETPDHATDSCEA
jgi:ABC-type transport system involved in cytochrome bd biosynthesis fused ATPase/permease subunit